MIEIFNKEHYTAEQWELINFCCSNLTTDLRQQTKQSSYIYVIKHPMTNLFKIGITKQIERRAGDLSKASGVALEYSFYYGCEPYVDYRAKDIESVIHKYYKSKRGIGEWFSITDEDVNNIQIFLEDLGLDPSFDDYADNDDSDSKPLKWTKKTRIEAATKAAECDFFK